MTKTKRATNIFDKSLHKALRLTAAASGRSISDMVNDAVRLSLAEDVEDLKDAEARQLEESISFESIVGDLRSSGQI